MYRSELGIQEGEEAVMEQNQKGDLDIITNMYRKHKNHFQSKYCRESIKDRIVSTSKQYVRPDRGRQGSEECGVLPENA